MSSTLKAEPRARRYLSAFGRFCRDKPLGAVSLGVVLLLICIAAFPSAFATHEYDVINISDRFSGPSSDYWFGTDAQGRDVFSRVMFGARTSVVIGFGAVAMALVISTIVGVSTGYYGGLWDLGVQRVVDIWQAFPGIIFIIFVVAIFGASTTTVVVSIGLLLWGGSSRVVRSAVVAVKSNLYVEAARSTGATDFRIMLRHILPNVVPVIIVGVSIQIGAVILIETSLSFLGFGVPPPFPSWGRMLQDAQIDMQRHPYLAVFPGVAIALTVYAFNMFGDALRDVLDPRMRGSR